MKIFYDSIGDDVANLEIVDVIMSYPSITHRLNAPSLCTVELIDSEGALYTTWNTKNFTKFKVEDDSTNVLFRGYLKNKRFNHNKLTLELVGFSSKLDWKAFNKNFIYVEGKVADVTPGAVATRLQLTDYEDVAYTWTANDFINDRDLAILIVDGTSSEDTTVWDTSAISTAGDTGESGGVPQLADVNDGSHYITYETSATPSFTTTITIDGDVIDHTKYLKKIIIDYRFWLRMDTPFNSYGSASTSLQISKDGSWHTVATGYMSCHGSQYSSKVGPPVGSGLDAEGNSANDYLCPDNGNNTELIKYFGVDGADDYDELLGMRFVTTGDIYGDDAAAVKVYLFIDYVKVYVEWDSYDIAPIMETITANGADTIDTTGIDWDETGVTSDDKFRIGENTTEVVSHIADAAGVNIEVLAIREATAVELVPDSDAGPNDWDTSGYVRVDEDKDTPDANMIYADNGDNGETETFGFPNTITAFLNNQLLESVTIHAYGKMSGDVVSCNCDVYYDGGWQGHETLAFVAGLSWMEVTFTLNGTVVPDDLKIEFNAGTASGNAEIWIDTVYITVNLGYINYFNAYMARWFKGNTCREALKSVCILEGADWFENHTDETVYINLEEQFRDTGVDLTSANYGYDWEYEDQCNNYFKIVVNGNAAQRIYAEAIDITVDSPMVFGIIDENIMTKAAARFAKLRSKTIMALTT